LEGLRLSLQLVVLYSLAVASVLRLKLQLISRRLSISELFRLIQGMIIGSLAVADLIVAPVVSRLGISLLTISVAKKFSIPGGVMKSSCLLQAVTFAITRCVGVCGTSSKGCIRVFAIRVAAVVHLPVKLPRSVARENISEALLMNIILITGLIALPVLPMLVLAVMLCLLQMLIGNIKLTSQGALGLLSQQAKMSYTFIKRAVIFLTDTLIWGLWSSRGNGRLQLSLSR
jgi:hypothetical protein